MAFVRVRSANPASSAARRYRWWLSPVIALACALTSLGAVTSVAAEPGLFDEYTLTSWTDEEGLFGGWIVGIVQDAHGYLWIGTVSGLIRFDGLDFERFHGRKETRLPKRSVSSIYAARDGSVWVGFSGGGGIYRIREQDVRDYGPSDGLGGGRTTAFVEDVDAAMLAVTPDGLYRLANDRWHRLGSADGLPDEQVFATYRDRTGALWAVTSDAVFRRQNPQDMFRPVAKPAEVALDLADAPNGTIWITNPSHGFSRLDPQHSEVSSSIERHGIGYRLLHDRTGNLWVATLGQGLWFVRNGNGVPQVVGAHNGLSNNTVRCVFEDRNGDVWVGTTVGLHRFARKRVTPITDLGIVRAVAAAHNGDVWVGTADGLVRFANGTRRSYGTKDGLPSGDVHALYVDPAGALWVATAAGVAVLTKGRFSPLPLIEGRWPPSGASTVVTIVADLSGTLWICTEDRGVFRWSSGRLSRVALPGADRLAAVHSISTDRNARLWFMLGGGGIGVIDRQGVFSLVRDSDKFHRSDLAVHEDDRGTLWFGSGDRLTRFKDGALSAITGANGLPEAIRAVVTDKDGHLWIGTSGGIIRVGDGEFDRVRADSERRVDYRSYNSSDGLPGSPVRLGYPNAVRSADGRLWFVTGNGVTVVDPARLSATRPAPAVRITRVSANGRSFEPAGPFELPPRTMGLQIDYTALEFLSPRQVQFRYRLDRLDNAWTDAGSRRQALFTHLPPGSYRFHVIARNSEGVWNERGDTLEFSIQPMFYQTRLFSGLCAVGIFGIAVLAWQVRSQQVRRRFKLILAERARMAREIHDTLLQGLAGLELQVDAVSSQLDSTAGQVKQQLDRIRRQIQSDVSEARQSIWGLRSPALEAHDLASALQGLGQSLTASSGVEFEFVVSGTPSRCAHKIEEHVLRVGREALSNAVRHAHARRLRLELHYDADSITLRVSDDGRGFDVGEAESRGGTHWGLTTMRERAAAIGGHLRLVSKPGEGTNLEMIAPLLSSSNS